MKKISSSLTITTRQFLKRYLDVDYTGKKNLSHKGMCMFAEEKGILLPATKNIKNLKVEDILMGNVVLVRAESSRGQKKAQIMAYRNPLHKSESQLMTNKQNKEELRKKREELLAEQGLEYDYWERVVDIYKDPTEEYQHHTVTESKGRVKIFKRSFAIHGGKNKK